RRSAAVNSGHAPVDVLPAAVSDGLSVARFHVARRNRSTNHLDGFGTSQAGDRLSLDAEREERLACQAGFRCGDSQIVVNSM
ncbi:MAG TPA: hypothetical protein VF951_16095, partial [Streptosporangiaceae bacterium]